MTRSSNFFVLHLRRSFKLLQNFNPNKKSFVLGKKPIGIVVDDIESINIDRPIDFEFAKFIKNNKLN